MSETMQAANGANAVQAQETENSGVTFRPNVDVLESSEELTLLADIPGADPSAIDIEFENGALTLHAKVAPREDSNRKYLVREYAVGDFHRTFQLHESIDAANIEAEYSNGVLKLHLPKVQAVRPRKIDVRTA